MYVYLFIYGSGALVTKSCPPLCDPMDCSPPGSSVHGISQTKILEWVAISYSRVSSQTRWILYHWATGEALIPAGPLR